MQGQLYHFTPYAADARPCYRCLLPEEVTEQEESCDTAGVLGSVVGVLGTLQATEIIQTILGHTTDLVQGTILCYDAMRGRVRSLQLPRRAACRYPRCTYIDD